ncbi:MAG TPA: hypothetical protein VGN20_10520 [Mucilaginibacter sp.]|jgi:hypothetical protein
MRQIAVIALIISVFVVQSFAGVPFQDSVVIMNAAKNDAKHFKYNKADKKFVKRNLQNPNSDYFKPTSVYTSQQALLGDSLYVKTFKYYALEKIKARRSLSTVLIVTGSVLAVLIAIGIVAQQGAVSF